MNYAMIKNGIVANIIWLYPQNISEFPNAVELKDRQVEIGDTYTDGKFYREGEAIQTLQEQFAGAIRTIDELCDFIAGVEE